MRELIFVLMMLMLPVMGFADNEITIDQAGDNFQLGVDQFGDNNVIEMLDVDSYITATSLDMYLVQYKQAGLTNRISFDEMSGSGNEMKLGQGIEWDTLDSDTDLGWYYDGWESGGHEIDITLYGDNNSLAVQQTNQTGASDGHNFDLHLAGDGNEVLIKQQSNGVKDIDLTIYNDYNNVFIRQKGNGAAHNATITLDGIYSTDLTLKQLSTQNKTFSISVDCMTIGGCTTSVEQN